MKKYFIISWNEEYLDADIVGGPLEESECEDALRKCIINSLLELKVVETTEQAEKMYDNAIHADSGNEESDATLSVYSEGGSILYESGYTEYYKVKPYEIPDELLEKKAKDLNWILTDDDSFQICREVVGFAFRGLGPVYELYQVQKAALNTDSCYKIAHQYVFLGKCDIDNILEAYDYQNVDEIKTDNRNRSIAEYEFELTAGNGDNLLSTPLLTYAEACAIIRMLSGYSNEEGE